MAGSHCDRCKSRVVTQRMGVFNDDILCGDCIEQEKEHKDYPRALIANEYALNTGNVSWQGLGKPDDLLPRTKNEPE